MTGIRFIADQNAIVLVQDASKKTESNSDSRNAGIAHSAPFRIDIDQTRAATDQDMDSWGSLAMLPAEEMAQIVVRCLNAAVSIDQKDLATASQALEIIVAQQLSKVNAEDPVGLMEEAMRYVLRQERWRFDIKRDPREDGVRLQLENPNGAEVPLGVHVSNRGKTSSFWVMQESRLVQGGHAYKIPIQAATSLKQAVTDYMREHDIGTINPHG